MTKEIVSSSAVMEHEYHLIEDLLLQFSPVLGADYAKYKNHVYRVFFNCMLLDKATVNAEKYAIAAAFHDVGIWTAGTIDYLDPSIDQVRSYLNAAGKQEWVYEIGLMINWHHKISSYEGNHQNTVETFRKADWIDVSWGLFSFGADRKKIKDNRRDFPNLGFHIFLGKKIFRNFLLHPFRPLPMFKR